MIRRFFQQQYDDAIIFMLVEYFRRAAYAVARADAFFRVDVNLDHHATGRLCTP
jgi:hypothetical protein